MVESAGVLSRVGVRNSVSESTRLRRVDGVFGKKIVFFDGVPGTRLEGVTGKGMANVCGFLLGDLLGDLLRDLEGEHEELGEARIDAADGDLGEDDARRRVKPDGLEGATSGGSNAIGILGTDNAFECN